METRAVRSEQNRFFCIVKAGVTPADAGYITILSRDYLFFHFNFI
ncbi:MAG: hypothetical protein WC379_17415 [Methanoregula sp.]